MADIPSLLPPTNPPTHAPGEEPVVPTGEPPILPPVVLVEPMTPPVTPPVTVPVTTPVTAPIPDAPAASLSVAPVAIVPQTAKTMQAHSLSNLVFAVGAVVMAVQSAAPQLIGLWPNVKWVGPTIFALGAVWKSLLTFMQQNNLVGVNYTPPP